jgi:hypothetical protein
MGSPALAMCLDWSLLGSDPARPQAPLMMGLATQMPTNSQAFECVDPGYTRAQIDFPAAVVVDGTAECANTALGDGGRRPSPSSNVPPRACTRKKLRDHSFGTQVYNTNKPHQRACKCKGQMVCMGFLCRRMPYVYYSLCQGRRPATSKLQHWKTPFPQIRSAHISICRQQRAEGPPSGRSKCQWYHPWPGECTTNRHHTGLRK